MQQKYNILYITSDQQHFDTIGKFNPHIKTPNLDRLCETGVYYDRAYTVNPTCTPTRASMITGTYPSQHGAWTLGTKLNECVPTIGGLMQQNGMHTALVGKAHFQPIRATEEYSSYESLPIMHDLDFWETFDQDFYGFETAKLTRNHTVQGMAGQHYGLWLRKHGVNAEEFFGAPQGHFDITKPYYWHIPEQYHYNAWIAEETEALLTQYQKDDKPFFLWASFFDPHPPYYVPDDYVGLYDPDTLPVPHVTPGEHDTNVDVIQQTQTANPDFSAYQKSGYALHGMQSHLAKQGNPEQAKKDMAVYYSMVTLMDKYIGNILDRLEALGLRENTIIVFTTDHGNYFGQHGLYAKGPFMYEDGIKVPYIVSCPGTIPQNVVSHALQSLVDIPVTMLDYCGIQAPYHMTGINQRKVWQGEAETARAHIICEHNHERDSVNLRAYVDEQYKLVIWFGKETGQFYDLKNDPEEHHNLWDVPEYQEIKQTVMMKYIQAELQKESLFMPRVDVA